MTKPTAQKRTVLRDVRVRLIQALLRWEGEVRSQRLQKLTYSSAIQVSRLLAKYRRDFPTALQASTENLFVYTPGPGAFPEPPSFDDYLRAVGPEGVPEFADARLAALPPDPALYATLRTACVGGHAVRIAYASMREPQGVDRLIVPRVLVRFGMRWHLRAWCTQRLAYRDFNLGRILRVSPEGPATVGHIPPDENWNTVVEVRFAPHRLLSAAQQRLIELEYGPHGGKLEVRAALLPYTLLEARIAVDAAQQPPPEYHLELANPEDVKHLLFNAAGPT